jgi:serine/threonine-protein phosphatase 5
MRVRREAVKIEPSNKDARTKLSECEKAIKKERFEAAIGMDASGTTQIDPDTIDVEASYKGPVLEEGQVTAQFVDELTEWLKQERKLHKKFTYQILYKVRDVLKAEKSVVDVPIPAGEHITVCGDVHGQYYDLINIFELNGKPSVCAAASSVSRLHASA